MSQIATVMNEQQIIPPSHASGFRIEMAREFARINATNPVWRSFKAKWDKRLPRKGTPRFDEYLADARAAQESVQTIFDQVRAEFA